MMMKLLKSLLITLIYSSLFTLLSLLPATAFADDIAVIVNENYPSANATLQEIKKIYLGEKKYEGKLLIKPMDQRDGSPIRQKFVEKALFITAENYKGFWIKKVFQEGALPPTVKANSQEVIDTVIQDVGSIGYVWAGETKGKSGIKVILTVKAD